jgi:hypothetical protein
MRAEITTFRAPKGGSRPEEYEDGYSPDDGDHEQRRLSCAVTDGATEGMLSGQWAKVVAEAFVDGLSVPRVLPQAASIVAKARSRWPAAVEAYRARRAEAERPLRWYEEEKLQQGAFATVVALQLSAGDPGFYRAYSVGDACLFHVRSGVTLSSFPIERPGDFGTTPDLLRSAGGQPRLRITSSDFTDGDCFYLCTDAVSHWVLSELTEGTSNPFDEIDELYHLNHRESEDWLAGLRNAHRMRNDDVTVMRVSILSAR